MSIPIFSRQSIRFFTRYTAVGFECFRLVAIADIYVMIMNANADNGGGGGVVESLDRTPCPLWLSAALLRRNVIKSRRTGVREKPNECNCKTSLRENEESS